VKRRDQTSISVTELRTALKGRVVEPSDDDYDEARTIFYGGEDRRPAAIAHVADPSDVKRVVDFARESGVELAVRSGGHSVARHSVVEGGIVLDLGAMKASISTSKIAPRGQKPASPRANTQPPRAHTGWRRVSETRDRWESVVSRSVEGLDISSVSTG
jgi:hypothetical protein